MNRKIQIALLSIIGVTLLAVIVFAAAFRGDKPNAPELIEAMLLRSNCTPPCFFGKSLQGKNIEEANNILSNSELMKDVELVHETKGNVQWISWSWPGAVKGRLTSDGLDMDQFFLYRDDDINYVGFRDGALTDMRIIFLMHLDELIDMRGEPTLMSVGIYRSEAAALAFIYENPSVHFISDLYCSHPQLTPDTPVWAYSFSSTPYDLTLNPTVSWEGYENSKLACNFPPP